MLKLEGLKKMKSAFTLAEVLVTLGVIGVIAAMTIPSLVNKANNKQLEAKFKTAYSMLYQAVLMMGKDDPELVQTYCGDGVQDNPNYMFINNFSKQFQIVNLYLEETYNLRKLGYEEEYFYSARRGRSKFNQDGHDNGAFIAKNGMVVLNSGCWWGRTIDFVVDTNGLKGPNKFGYDVFYFQIANNNQLLPSSINSIFAAGSAAQEAGCCTLNGDGHGTAVCNPAYSGSFGQSWTDNGTACSRFAIMDSFPGEEGKSYWQYLPTP